MSWQSDVADGAAQRLADLNIGTWTPDGSAGTIHRGAIPPNVNFGIGIQTYRAGPDNPGQPNTRLRIQFMLRAPDNTTLDDTDAAIYDAFMALAGVELGSAHVVDTQAISSLPMGLDESGNPQRACNYQLDLDLPATPLRSY